MAERSTGAGASSNASPQGPGPTAPEPVPSLAPTERRSHESAAGPSATAPAKRRKQKLIYILGTGRCGSTVFEIVLGSHPQIQATGEFHGLPFPKWMPGTVCACGKTYEQCPFWSPVREEYRRHVDFDRQLETQGRFEYYRCLPRSLLHRALGTKEIRRHAKGMADLIHVIAQCSGKEVVSESSKSAARGYMYTLARSEDFDVYYIHLVRDGRGYMYSKTTVPDGAGYGKEQLVLNPWEITVRWVTPNLLAKLLCSRPKDRYLRIRYEDFVARPVDILEQVGRYVGMDLSPVIEKVRGGKPIAVGHLIGGNRLRFNPTITLETRFTKAALGTRSSRWAFWTLGGWMAFWYGYPPPARISEGPGTSR